VEIVEQPAVEAFCPQRFLYCRHIERHPVSISLRGSDLDLTLSG
jgi:hypothetical protein